jgi:hypothetical protein
MPRKTNTPTPAAKARSASGATPPARQRRKAAVRRGRPPAKAGVDIIHSSSTDRSVSPEMRDVMVALAHASQTHAHALSNLAAVFATGPELVTNAAPPSP